MAYTLSDDEELILVTVKKSIDEGVAPVASELVHNNYYRLPPE